MKDMPALLLAVLSRRDGHAFARAFPRVVDNGRMLRNFVQVMRSGATGRKSLGSRPKAEIQGWLNAATDRALMRAAVGQSPSLADVVKMVHPKPATPERRALYAWLLGKPYDVAMLPEPARSFEAFKRDRSNPVPDVPFQMLTALDLTPEQLGGDRQACRLADAAHEPQHVRPSVRFRHRWFRGDGCGAPGQSGGDRQGACDALPAHGRLQGGRPGGAACGSRGAAGCAGGFALPTFRPCRATW